MANGLLDWLNTPAGQGLLATAAGAAASYGHGRGLLGNVGNGALMGLQAYTGANDTAARQKYMDAQMANLASEVETRKAGIAKQQQIMALLTGDGSQPSQNYQTGQLGSGSFGAMPTAAGVPAISPPTASSGAGKGGRIASMTPDTLAALKANGLDLTDVYKLTQPDMQVTNGYAYDRRNLQPGFLPQANVSQNGQAVVMLPGPDGMPRVSMPAGALDAYSAYRNADEAAKAGQDLVKVVGPDGAERYVTRSQAIQASQPTAPQPAAVVPRAAAARPTAAMPGDADRYAILTQELAKAQASGNAGDAASIQREIERLPASARTATNPSGLAVPMQASPTTQQAAQAAAEKERQVQITKDIGEQRKSLMAAGFNAPSNIAKYQQIGKLLADVDGGSLTPAGTEFASKLNSLGIKIDKGLGNKQAAEAMGNELALQLRSPAGGAGMPGALSDGDRKFLSSMTPNMAQSLEGRTKLIQSRIALEQRNQQVATFARNYEKKYGKLDNGFFDQLQAWSSANPLFKGQ